jgi:mRNA interferase RelE/StbE
VAYRIVFRPAAERDLVSLPQNVRERIDDRLKELVEDPRPPGVKKMGGEESLYRIRVGGFRIVYAVDDDSQTVHIKRIGSRNEIYRLLRRL